MSNPVIDTILSRRSVRGYLKTPVPDELVEEILKCGMYAPNGLGLQGWHFTVVRDRALLDAISDANKQLTIKNGDPDEIARISTPDYDTFRGAPMAIIISGHTDEPWHDPSCANAATVMTLAAESLGLSTCYIGGFRDALYEPEGAELVARLELPENCRPLYALALGYKGLEPKAPKPRRENCVNYIG
ncbi:MAG: nitroreductase family protein [Oscillospiraceae bacterium]|nr:nitroreductase family protein [Oscillospiraceae bacterium]